MRQPIPRHVARSINPGKQRIPFGEPIAFPKSHPRFIEPPPPSGHDLTMQLEAVVTRVAAQAATAGVLAFHMVGDTGGFNGTSAEEAVAHAMEAQIRAAEAEGRPAPGFFYHLGDVVYLSGEPDYYDPQFYDPYKYYPREIFAIPGNHDGENLASFMKNFCDSQRRDVDPYRMSMNQPHCYFRLDTRFVSIIGLYSNVDGMLDPRGGNEQQRQWLVRQLKEAPKDRPLIVAVHHPPYSLDQQHGGSPDIASALDRAMLEAGRVPDAVVSGHVHLYERFLRTLSADFGGGTLPYLVAGAGGFAHRRDELYDLQVDEKDQPFAQKEKTKSAQDPDLDLTYECGNAETLSFLRVTADATELRFDAFAVSFDGSWKNEPFDSVTVKPRYMGQPPGP